MPSHTTDDNRTLHQLRATQHRDISHTVLARGPPCPLLKRMEQFLNAFRKQVPGHRPKPTAARRPQPKDTTGRPSTKSSPPDKPLRQAGADTVCCAPQKVSDQWFAWQHTARQVISSFVPQPVTNTFNTVCDGMMKNYQEGCTTLCGALELPRNDKRRD